MTISALISSFAQPLTISDRIDRAFEPIVAFLENVFFWDPVKALGIEIEAQVPIVVLWLVFGGIFFTFRNVRTYFSILLWYMNFVY